MTLLLRWVLRAILVAGWVPVAFFLMHLSGVFLFHAYRAVPHLDVGMHFFGGMVIAWFFRRAVELPEAEPVLGTQSPLGRSLFAWTALGTAAAFWEFAEWTTDRLGFPRAQRGLDDTMADMAIGIAGGTLLLVVFALLLRPEPQTPPA